MRVNITSYETEDSAQGSTYSVGLRFILEDNETPRDLGKDRINARRKDPGDTTTLTNTTGTEPLIPFGNTPFPGKFAETFLDGPDADSLLTSITYGGITTDKDELGIQRCYRDVQLEYEPEDLQNGAATRPPNNSRGNDPDLWFPEYDRTSETFEEIRPLEFYGYHPRPLPSTPITPDDPDLIAVPNGGPGMAIGSMVDVPRNALGQIVRPVQTVTSLAYADTFIEYGKRYVDPAFDLEDRQGVVNDRDLIVRVACAGQQSPWPVEVRYPKGTAYAKSYSVACKIYKYRDPLTGNSVSIPFMVRRTTILVKGSGWTINVPNVATFTRDNGSGALTIPYAENGPIREAVPIDQLGERTNNPGSMIYGRKISTFAGLLGNTTGNVITVT